MSSESRANEYPRASAILGGLSLVTQLAATATDSMPIAKLAVGVVSQIVKLAEDIEKRRTALHALAETARSIGESIDAVVSHRKPSEQVESSLKGLLHVFHAIQVLFAKHKAKHPFFKALSYAFTTAGHIDDLTRELSRASQQFTLVAGLDTNARAREAEARLEETNARLQNAQADIQELQSQVEKNSYYTGQFRNLHDCDVDKLELITEYARPCHRHSIKYYTARVETSGSIMVLRYIERNAQFDSEKYSDDDDYVLHTVDRRDRILEEFSKVQHSHRNIARIYGVSQGDPLTRFTVMTSGHIPFSLRNGRTPGVAETWELIIQLMDAISYLHHNGLDWDAPLSIPFFFDTANLPIIGLTNGFVPSSMFCWGTLFLFEDMLSHAYSKHWKQSRPRKRALDNSFGTAPVQREIPENKTTVLRKTIDPLNGKSLIRNPFDLWRDRAGAIPHAAPSDSTVGSTFYTKYYTNFRHNALKDYIVIARVDEREDELVDTTVFAQIPTSMAETFRKKLGITVEGPPYRAQTLESFDDPSEPETMQFMPLCL